MMMSSIVIEVSAMLVAITTLRWPLGGRWKTASCSEIVIGVIISGYQWKSVVISDTQRYSVALSGHQYPSVPISTHQWSSVVISDHQ